MTTVQNPLTQPVEIDFALGDFYSVLLRNPKTWMIPWVGAFLTACALWLIDLAFEGLPYIQMRGFPWRFMVIFGAVLSLLSLVVNPGLDFRRMRKRLKGRSLVLQLTTGGVRSEIPEGESLYYWSQVKRVQMTKNRLLLFVKNGSAFIVPRRAFDDRGAFAEWARIAERQWRRAHAT